MKQLSENTYKNNPQKCRAVACFKFSTEKDNTLDFYKI